MDNNKYVNMYDPHNFLHGFLLAELKLDKGRSLKILLHVSILLGIPLAKNKISGPFTTLKFLCITLDTSFNRKKIEISKVIRITKITCFFRRT